MEREVNDGLDELKTWAGNDHGKQPAVSDSIGSSFIEAEVVDTDSDLSFALIPSTHTQTGSDIERKSPINSVMSEVNEIERRSNSAASTMSFECIDSLNGSEHDRKSDSDFSLNNSSVIEVEPRPDNEKPVSGRGDQITTEEEKKIEEAVRRQAHGTLDACPFKLD